MADSIASEPELTKNTVSRSPGASSVMSSAASTAAGWAADHTGEYARVSICFDVAAGMSLRPWPMLTQNRPARPSRKRFPRSS